MQIKKIKRLAPDARECTIKKTDPKACQFFEMELRAGFEPATY